MKKLCLILTVLYAIWANCSAQSLNNAGNLLDSKSSTFEYAPTEEDDSEAAPELTSGWENNGLIVKIDFEEVGKDCH